MPTEKEEQQHAPETDRTYERADPRDESPDGSMDDKRNTPVDEPDGVQSSVQNDRIRKPLTDDDTIDDAATADPTGRKDADPKNAVPNTGTQPGKSDRTRKTPKEGQP